MAASRGVRVIRDRLRQSTAAWVPAVRTVIVDSGLCRRAYLNALQHELIHAGTDDASSALDGAPVSRAVLARC